jgi:hypothetical protein
MSRVPRSRSSVPPVVFEQATPNGYVPPRARWSAAALPALGAMTIVVVGLAWIDPTVLCIIPALALALLLALRRYPGESLLVRLSPGRLPERRRPPRSAVPPGRLALTRPRGGLLLACSLADRPPPLVAPAAR